MRRIRTCVIGQSIGEEMTLHEKVEAIDNFVNTSISELGSEPLHEAFLENEDEWLNFIDAEDIDFEKISQEKLIALGKAAQALKDGIKSSLRNIAESSYRN